MKINLKDYYMKKEKKITTFTIHNGYNASLSKKLAYAVCEQICKIFKLKIILEYSGKYSNTGDFDFSDLDEAL